MGRYAYGDADGADAIVADAIVSIGRDIEALKVPHLAGVVLGGGYGRGEGGVFIAEDGTQSLSNDLDFFAIADAESTSQDLEAITRALLPISEEWTRKLGISVDFSPPKTPWRLKHDEERLMVQELIHGCFDVAGAKGEELFRNVDLRDPTALPWTEAARLLVNRGAGLILARDSHDEEFVVRNVNKCILGCGDALLISQHAYAWKAERRARTLCDALYSRALAWKFRPQKKPVCPWEIARKFWLETVDKVFLQMNERRTLWQAARWIARRRSLCNPFLLGYEPVVIILRRMRRAIYKRRHFSKSLRKDWEVFN